MSLEAPVLDTTAFEKLLGEARLRIPRYTEKWTNYNESDPGRTLLPLLTWLAQEAVRLQGKIRHVRGILTFFRGVGMSPDI